MEIRITHYLLFFRCFFYTSLLLLHINTAIYTDINSCERFCKDTDSKIRSVHLCPFMSTYVRILFVIGLWSVSATLTLRRLFRDNSQRTTDNGGLAHDYS